MGKIFCSRCGKDLTEGKRIECIGEIPSGSDVATKYLGPTIKVELFFCPECWDNLNKANLLYSNKWEVK
jgi:hypothetical protein